jgi:hypothetical protein
VEVCPHALESARPTYAALGRPAAAAGDLDRLAALAHAADGGGDLPRGLSRRSRCGVEPGIIEQSMGDWHGCRMPRCRRS